MLCKLRVALDVSASLLSFVRLHIASDFSDGWFCSYLKFVVRFAWLTGVCRGGFCRVVGWLQVVVFLLVFDVACFCWVLFIWVWVTFRCDVYILVWIQWFMLGFGMWVLQTTFDIGV